MSGGGNAINSHACGSIGCESRPTCLIATANQSPPDKSTFLNISLKRKSQFLYCAQIFDPIPEQPVQKKHFLILHEYFYTSLSPAYNNYENATESSRMRTERIKTIYQVLPA